MNFSIDNRDGAIIISLESEINYENVSDFSRAMEHLIESGHSRIVLDLSRAGFIVSQGLGKIASLHRLISKSGGNIKLFGLNSRVRKSFDISGISGIVEVCATEAEALASLKKDAQDTSCKQEPK